MRYDGELLPGMVVHLDPSYSGITQVLILSDGNGLDFEIIAINLSGELWKTYILKNYVRKRALKVRWEGDEMPIWVAG